MKAHGEKLSRKQELAIAALLTCRAITDAAHQCGIGEVTLHRWLKDAGFQTAYREARRAVVQQAITQVQRATGEAVETLRNVMQDPEAPASARVSAARVVLETAVKAVELEDLEARILALETQQGMTR
jgi:DNA-binding MurR/RpiR family transcriptional regulator